MRIVIDIPAGVRPMHPINSAILDAIEPGASKHCMFFDTNPVDGVRTVKHYRLGVVITTYPEGPCPGSA